MAVYKSGGGVKGMMHLKKILTIFVEEKNNIKSRRSMKMGILK